MRRIRRAFICISLLTGFLFSVNKKSDFLLVEKNGLKKINLQNSVNLKYSSKDLVDHVLSNFEISDDIILPSHSTFYQLEDGRDIEVSLNIDDSNYDNYDDFFDLTFFGDVSCFRSELFFIFFVAFLLWRSCLECFSECFCGQITRGW